MSENEYTPDTGYVRQAYAARHRGMDAAQSLAEFDRWFATLTPQPTGDVAELIARVEQMDGQFNWDEIHTIVNALEKSSELASTRQQLAEARKLSGQANYLLARVLSVANVSAIDGADGFIERYDMPVGPIHKIIPFLNEQGIVVTNDGQILNSPEVVAAYKPTTVSTTDETGGE